MSMAVVDTAVAAAYMEAAIRETAPDDEAMVGWDGRNLLVNHALYVLRDPELALEHRRATMGDGWRDDYRAVIFFADWCLEHKVNLVEAEELALQGVEMAAADEEEGKAFAAWGMSAASDIAFARGDSLRAFEIRKSSMPAGWQDDGDQLNRLAWWCFERRTALEEAETLARRGVDLATPGASRARVLDTLAEIRHLFGDTEEALELIREAHREDPEDSYYSDQFVRFERLVNETR